MLDGSQGDGCFAVVNGRALVFNLLEKRCQLPCEFLRNGRAGRVLVDHPSCGRLQGGGHGCRRIGYVAVDQSGETVRLMPGDNRLEQKEELLLPLG